MRNTKVIPAVAAFAMSTLVSANLHAYTYDFSTLTGSTAPGVKLVDSPAMGSFGQDSWSLTSGTTSYVRNDGPTGFTGNYLAGAPSDSTTGGQDSIMTRLDGPYGSLGLGGVGVRYVTLQFDGWVGPAGYNNGTGVAQYRRSELAPGVDVNADGDIRSTTSTIPADLTAENKEVGPQFGYESTGTGWYLRRAAYSNTGTATALTTASGVYQIQLVIDLQSANISTVPDVNHGGFVNDGSGTLYVKQLSDASGNAVNDVFRLASTTTTNLNLGLSGMGGGGGADPAFWNGFNARTAQNGGIDNIKFTNGLPSSTSVWAADAGDWLNAANWYIGIPNAVGAVAELTTGARSNSTVYAESAVTLGTLNIGNTTSYNISGNGSLTMQTASGNAAINVTQGSQKINLPLTIASNTVITTAAGTTLKISDPVTINSGKTITQTGAGTVSYESTISVLAGGSIAFGNSSHAASLSLASAASASIADGAARSTLNVDALSLATGSTLNINKNELLATITPSDTRLAIVAGKLISGSSSSTTGLGYGDVGSGKTRIIYTRLGDATLDRTVNFDDLIKLAQNYNGTGKVWAQGDFTYDGTVNFDDLIKLAQSYNQSVAGETLPASVGAGFASDWALAQSLVPEPTTLALLGLPLATMARRRRM